MWTSETLSNLASEKFEGTPLIVVSNREPYVHANDNGVVDWSQPASGVTAGLDPILQACGGTWIAQGVGEADFEVADSQNKVAVPPTDPRYTLKRVRLSESDREGFYDGMSNNGLWPLCHVAYTSPIFKESDWESYKKVNRIFADAILEEIKGKPAFVFIQDYHFALLARYLKLGNPSIITAQFWHIPWPDPEVLARCPWQEEILEGLLGNDLLAFHTTYYGTNFLNSVERNTESRIDYDYRHVFKGGHRTSVRAFPMGVDFESINEQAKQKEVGNEVLRLKEEMGLADKFIGVGLDRLDYTKGVLERLNAIDRLLELNPEYKDRLVFLQLGAASRMQVDSYRDINHEINRLIERINIKYGNDGWVPVIRFSEDPGPTMRMATRMMADFYVVSSLHDGMNLVAKEFVASRHDEGGSLILSPFTGAADELREAFVVNPYATDEFARTIDSAIKASPQEKRRRMISMRSVVRDNTIYKWAADLITAMTEFESQPIRVG